MARLSEVRERPKPSWMRLQRRDSPISVKRLSLRSSSYTTRSEGRREKGEVRI
jgi:hypothetical protein